MRPGVKEEGCYNLRQILSKVEIGALGCSQRPGSGEHLCALFQEASERAVPANFPSVPSLLAHYVQKLATATKLWWGEDGNVAVDFVDLSCVAGYCCLLYFSCRLSRAHAWEFWLALSVIYSCGRRRCGTHAIMSKHLTCGKPLLSTRNRKHSDKGDEGDVISKNNVPSNVACGQ